MKTIKKSTIIILLILLLLLSVLMVSCGNSTSSPNDTSKISNEVAKTKLENFTNENFFNDIASCFGNLFYNVTEEKIKEFSQTYKQVSVETTFKANIKNKDLRLSLIFNNDLDDESHNCISLKAEHSKTKENLINLTVFQADPFIEKRQEGEGYNRKEMTYYNYNLNFILGTESSYSIPFSSDKKFIPITKKDDKKTKRQEITESVNDISKSLAEYLVIDNNRNGEYYRGKKDDFYTRSYDITIDVKETLIKLAEKLRFAQSKPKDHPISPNQKQKIVDAEDALTSIFGVNLTERRSEFEIAPDVIESGMPPAELRLIVEVENISKPSVYGGKDVRLKTFKANFDVKKDEKTKDKNFRFKGESYSSSLEMEIFENAYKVKKVNENFDDSKPVFFDNNYIIIEAEVKEFNSLKFDILNDKIKDNDDKTTMLEVVAQYTPRNVGNAQDEQIRPSPLFSIRLYNKSSLTNQEKEELFSLYIKDEFIYINVLSNEAEEGEVNTKWWLDNDKNFIDDFLVEFNNYYRNRMYLRKFDEENVRPDASDIIAYNGSALITKFLTYFYVNGEINDDSLNIYINVPLIAQTVFHKNPTPVGNEQKTNLHDDLFNIWSAQLGEIPEDTRQKKFIEQGFEDGFFFDEESTFELYFFNISECFRLVESAEGYKICDDGASLDKLD